MKKRIAVDMALNIIASAIPVFVLQLFILPAVSSVMESERYGFVVTIISMFTVVSAATGNTLNNIRLICGSSVKKTANFNTILLSLTVLNFIVVTTAGIYYEGKIDLLNLFINAVVSTLWLIKEYIVVTFRIDINFLKIVKSNIVLSIGYVIGYFVFRMTGIWQFIYLIGLLICIIFVCFKSDLWKEPLVINTEFKNLAGQTGMYLIATVLYKIPSYADRIIAYPILGGTNTSVLYVATLFSKIISMAITPVSGVILSYISKSKNKNDKSFSLVFALSSAIGILGYFVCLIFSRPILGYLYPREIESAMVLIPITTGTIIINSLITVVDPYILNFFDMKWQIIINAIYLIIYTAISLFLLMKFGLYGFCLGMLFSEFLKLIFELLIFYKANDVKKSEI